MKTLSSLNTSHNAISPARKTKNGFLSKSFMDVGRWTFRRWTGGRWTLDVRTLDFKLQTLDFLSASPMSNV